MNWSDLAPAIGAAAPTLGRLLGGALPIPFGGLIGDAVGNAIAGALGVEATPAAVAGAVGATRNDVLIAQLQTAEAEAAARYKALGEVFAQEAQSTAQTTQAELVSGTWYQKWWRPLAMYIWIASWPIQLGAILLHQGPESAAIVQALAIWNACPAALAGVYSFGRTQEKIAAAQ